MEFSEVIEVLDRGSSIDVQSNCTFESLMIGQKTLERLKASQFDRPSPVQAKAIPVGLLGRDMLVQAKSGTGKTLVFSVLAVENLDLRSPFIQKVIVTPTREISVQIKETVRKVAPAGARTSVYVGGSAHKLNMIDLKQTRPQIVIGTPGRIAQLLKCGAMDISHVDFFVLDEADKLMDDVFKNDINGIINSLPPNRQVAVFSATYPRNLDNLLSTFLRDAALVRFNADDVQLVGIKQYVVTKCSPMFEKLTHVLKSIRYVQALVFCDQISKCEPIATHLKSEGLDVTFVSSAMSQKERQLAVDQLRMKRVKILVSSDLTARGIDADNVNLVVNIDAAANEETYFHRIGRAARFGAHGAAVTLLEDERALKCFTALAYRGKVSVKRVGQVEMLPDDLVKNQEFWKGLSYFIDCDKSTKSPGSNDLDKVPDRKSAIEALEKEREASGISTSSLKYDRDDMMTMRPTSSGDSDEIVKKTENLSIENDEKENVEKEKEEKKEEEIVVKKSFKERLAELKAVAEAKKLKSQGNKEPEVAKVVENKTKFNEITSLSLRLLGRTVVYFSWTISKFFVICKTSFLKGLYSLFRVFSMKRFVPTREKAKKKYYMRGELQHIRDAFTGEQWRAYAASKFDLSQEPFLDAFGVSEASGSAPAIVENGSGDAAKLTEVPKKASKTDGNSKNPVKNDKNPSKIIKYNRGEMTRICKNIPKHQWLPYVKSKWDTTEEPWELDPWMRCSFEERLRRIRKREKDERKRVIEDRKKKRDEDRSELVAIGKITQPVTIKETSWSDYKTRILNDFKEKTAKRKQEELEGKEKNLRRIGPVVPERQPPLIYRYRLDMYKRRLEEQDAFLMQQTKLEDGKIKETEIQTEQEAEKPKELVEIECQTDEVKVEDVGKGEEEDEEYWDEEEEYWDEEEEYVEQEEEDVGHLQRLQQEQLAQLGAGYIRNINFQAATQSYMDLMNSFSRNFSGN